MNEDNSAPADGARSRREFLAAAAVTLAAASLPTENARAQQSGTLADISEHWIRSWADLYYHHTSSCVVDMNRKDNSSWRA